jgi:hypothetical protein
VLFDIVQVQDHGELAGPCSRPKSVEVPLEVALFSLISLDHVVAPPDRRDLEPGELIDDWRHHVTNLLMKLLMDRFSDSFRRNRQFAADIDVTDGKLAVSIAYLPSTFRGVLLVLLGNIATKRRAQ